MSDTWNIGELAEQAAEALRANARPLNGRIRDMPGERLIRWYTTIGLVDPPLTRRGRIARYGRRHLLQLLAIKRLQAAGRSIAEIQAALVGATDAMLEQAAEAPGQISSGVGTSTPPPDAKAPPPGTKTGTAVPAVARERFWAGHPDGAHTRTEALSAVQAPAHAGTDTTDSIAESTVGEERSGALVSGVRLGAGVMLVLDGASRTPSEEDVRAVRAAAAPLLAALQERKLA
jgi:hypothetical protein